MTWIKIYWRNDEFDGRRGFVLVRIVLWQTVVCLRCIDRSRSKVWGGKCKPWWFVWRLETGGSQNGPIKMVDTQLMFIDFKLNVGIYDDEIHSDTWPTQNVISIFLYGTTFRCPLPGDRCCQMLPLALRRDLTLKVHNLRPSDLVGY